jgi:Zn finger protein HypA/HybF involved in hydrogenase expression
MSNIGKLTKNQLEKYINDADNWVELRRLCGYNNIGNNEYLIKKLNDYNIDYSKLNEKKEKYKSPKKYTLEEIFCENSTYKGTKIRDYLINDMNFDYKCNICGITEWMGKFINLEVDHINGNHTDNRIKNLQCICPLCHSMTDNYKGKNKGKIENLNNKCISCNIVLENDNIRCDNCQEFSDKVITKPSFEEIKKFLQDNLLIKDIAMTYKVTKSTVNNWIREYLNSNTDETKDDK